MGIFTSGFNLNGQLCEHFLMKHCICPSPTSDTNLHCEGKNTSKLNDVVFAQNCIYWRKDSTWKRTGQPTSKMPSEAQLSSIRKIATNLHRTVGINCKGEVVQFYIDSWHIIPIDGTDVTSLTKNAHDNLNDPSKKRKANEPFEGVVLHSRFKVKKQISDENVDIQKEVDGTTTDSHDNTGGASVELEYESIIEDLQESFYENIDNKITFTDVWLFDDNTLLLLDDDGRLWKQEQRNLDNKHIQMGSCAFHPQNSIHLFWPVTSDSFPSGTESEAPDGNANLKLTNNYNTDTKTDESPRPLLYLPAANVHHVTEVAVGLQHGLLRTRDGAVFTWGDGMRGQLGIGELCNRSEPGPVPLLEGVTITSVAAGGWHCLALGSCGEVYVWGWNSHGQLGLPCKPSHPHDDLEDDLTLDCQTCHCAKGLEDENRSGSQGVPPHAQESTPSEGRSIVNVQSTPLMLETLGMDEGVAAAAAGDRHSLFVMDDGAVWSCGWNKYGQRGLCCKRKRRYGVDAPLHRVGHHARIGGSVDDEASSSLSGGCDQIATAYSRTGSEDVGSLAAVSGTSSAILAIDNPLPVDVSGSEKECFESVVVKAERGSYESIVARFSLESELARVPLPKAVKEVWAGGWYSVFQT